MKDALARNLVKLEILGDHRLDNSVAPRTTGVDPTYLTRFEDKLSLRGDLEANIIYASFSIFWLETYFRCYSFFLQDAHIITLLLHMGTAFAR